MKNFFTVCFSLLMLSVCGAEAKSSMPVNAEYCFRSITMEDGLSHTTVTQIVQDRRGFIWFGTHNGLNRFDGKSFRIYNSGNSNLQRNFTSALMEDSSGRLWIGTDDGAFLYDPATDSISALKDFPESGFFLDSQITGFQEDNDGNIWMSAEKYGIFKISSGSGKATRKISTVGKPNIFRFFLDGDKLWYSSYSDNLYVTDTTFRTAPRPFRNNLGEESFKGDVVHHISSDGRGNIYISSKRGLFRIDAATLETEMLVNDFFRVHAFYSENELWAGTESGLYILDLSTGTKVHIKSPEQANEFSLSDNAVYSLCRDSEGGIWIGTFFGGVNYYPPRYTRFDKYWPHDEYRFFGKRVREFCKDASGRLWIGTEDKGLFYIDNGSAEICRYPDSRVGTNIHGLCADGDKLWVGTFSGALNRIDLEKGTLEQWERGDEQWPLPSTDAFTIRKTRDSLVWIGTTLGTAVYDPSRGSFSKIEELGEAFVYYILEDRLGRLWFATYADGIYFCDRNTGEWRHWTADKTRPGALPGNKFCDIFEDSRGSLWIATVGEGLCRYDEASDRFERFSADWMPSSIIFKILEDEAGNLWISTGNGLVSFNPETGAHHIYTVANGLVTNQFNFSSAFESDSGRLWFGTICGFITFDPKAFVIDDNPPGFVVTDLFISGVRQYPNATGSPLKTAIDRTGKIVLKHYQNTFSVKASVLSFHDPDLYHLEYRIDSGQWERAGADNRIYFSNLHSGRYRLEMRCTRDGIIAIPDSKTLIIRIKPPFYRSVAAYLLYFVLAGAAVFAAFQWYRHRQKIRRAIQMKEFEYKKEKELYASKIDFFTDVAHEIRTPLTLIKCPLENMMQSSDIPDNLKHDLDVMSMNTDRLMDLVNQLLDFRKIESGGINLNIVTCNVTELLERHVKIFEPYAVKKGLGFSVSMPGPVTMSVDCDAFIKIVSNMLNNAFKYASSYVSLMAGVNDGVFEIVTHNDGDKVPESMMEEIFKPFVRIGSGELTVSQGSGIGLALARNLAEALGGTLAMDASQEDNCFRFSLPVSVVPGNPAGPGPQEPENAESLLSESPALSQRRFTVLVVEDNAQMLSMIAGQMEEHYKVYTARNGNEALDVLSHHTVNVVVSDVMMPGMDGMGLCSAIRKSLDFSHIPVLLLTARTDIQSKIAAMNIGADMYVDKPFSMAYLLACVGNLINERDRLSTVMPAILANKQDEGTMTRAEDKFVRDLKAVMEENMSNPDFNVQMLADALCMSRSSLARIMKSTFDCTVMTYIHNERMKKAASLLRTGKYRVNQVMYMTGYNTPSYFVKVFKNKYGVLPKDFMK
ncbi:MAG: two-component regulator propeller domain-containing protein [Candidatus Cryptobacteroides sp.]